MIRFFFSLGILITCLSCNFPTAYRQNPYIPETPVSFTVYLNLPSYSALNYANNSVLVPSQGYNGVIIFNNGSGFVAYEATCSNHPVTPQSRLTLNGEIAVCNQCSRSYYLLNGQPTSETESSRYFLLPYVVEFSGNTLHIHN